jgi:hypothetical protein
MGWALDSFSNRYRAMNKPETADELWRGMICLSLAVGFEEDRASVGLPAAVSRLRNALAYNGLYA